MSENLGLEYGVKFNVADGAKQATDEIKALSEQWQSILDKQKLVIKMGADASQYAPSNNIQQNANSTSNISGLKSQLSDLEKQWARLSTAERQGSDGSAISSKWQRLTAEAGQYAGTIRQLTKEQEKQASSSPERVSGIHSETAAYQKQSDMVSSLKNTALQYLSVYEGVRLIKSIADITGEFELQQKSLAAILRDADKANEILSQVKSLAIISPFQVKDLLSYTKQLAAYRIETDQLFDTMKNLADVSAGLGVDMSRIILAYGQVNAASILRGQELRQFTEAGIPMVSLLAEKFTELEGRVISTGEVFKKISERLVPFAMVKDIFSDMTSEGGMFYNMQEIQAETLKGKISNLTDAYNIMFNDIGSGGVVNDVMKGTVDLMTSMARNWRDIAAVIIPAVGAIGSYKATLLILSGVESARNIQNSVAIAQSEAIAVSTAKESAALAVKTAAEQANLLINKARISSETASQILLASGVSKDNAKTASQTISNLTLKAGTDARIANNLQKEISLALQTSGLVKDEAEIAAMNIKSVSISRATTASSGLFSSIGNLIKLNISAWITGGLGAITAIALVIYQWYENTNRLRNELSKLDNDGSAHSDNLVNKFKILATTALDTSKSVKEQDDALKTLKNTYGDILPEQLLTIDGLTKLEGKYNDVTRAIRENIEASTKKKKEEAISTNYGDIISDYADGLKTDLKDVGVESSIATRAVSELKRRIMDKDMEQGNPFKELLIILKEMEGINIDFQKVANGSKNMGELNSGAFDLLNTIRSMNSEIKELDSGKTTWYGEFSAQAKAVEGQIDFAKKAVIKGKHDIDGVLTPFDESLYRFNERKATVEKNELIAFLEKTGKASYDVLKEAYEKNKTIGLGISFDKYFVDSVKRIDNLDVSSIAKKSNEIIENMAKAQGVPASQYNNLAYSPQSGVDAESSNTTLIKRHQELEESIKRINRANKDWVSDITVIDYISRNISTATKEQELNGCVSMGVRNKGLKEELTIVESLMNARGLVDKKDKKPQVVNEEIEILKEQLALIEQAKKAYTELRNSGMNADAAQSKIKSTYGKQIDKRFKIAFDNDELRADFKTYMDLMDNLISTGNKPTKNAAIKAKAAVQLLIDKSFIDDSVKMLNEQLKEIETTFNKDKKRIDIFKNILDTTGDYDLAGRIAKSFEGDGTTNIEIALKSALKKSFSSAGMGVDGMFDSKGNVDIEKAQSAINNRRATDISSAKKGQVTDTKITDAMQKQLDATKDFQEKEVMELLKGLNNFKSYEQKRADIIQKGIEERKLLESQSKWTPEQKATETNISLSKQKSEISKVSIEQFKGSDQWAMVFSDIENVSAPVIDRLKKKLIDFKNEAGNTLPTQEFKELTKTITDLEKRTSSIGFSEFFNELSKDHGIPKLIEALGAADAVLRQLNLDLSTKKEVQVTAQSNYDTSVSTGESTEAQAAKLEILKAANLDVSNSVANLTEATKAQQKAESDLAAAQNAKLVAAQKATISINGLSTAFTDMKNVIDSTIKAFYDVSSAMGIAIDPETKAILDGITSGLGATISVLAAVSAGLAVYTFFASAAGAATWVLLAPILAVLAPILLLIAAFSIWHSIDLGKTNAKIAAQAKIVEDLKAQYDELERTMKDALGSDWIEKYNQELINLGQTNTGLNEQLRLEQSKSSKDQDAEKIKSLQKDISDNNVKIAESSKKLQQFVTGTDLASAAKSFAQAWLDAYKSFGNTTEAMETKFKDLMSNMAVNMLLSKGFEMFLAPVMAEIEKQAKSGEITKAGWDSIWKSGNVFITNAEAYAKGVSEKYDLSKLQDASTNLTGVSKGITGVTEDTALLLGGYLNSMRQRMFTYFDAKSTEKAFDLPGSMASLLVAQNTQITHLAAISLNTMNTVNSVNNLADKIEKVTSLSGNRGTYALNVNA